MNQRALVGAVLAVLLGVAVAWLLPGGIGLGVLLLLLLPMGLVLGLRVEPGLLLALALAGSMLSGYADLVGLPISPDRPLFALALGATLAGGPVGAGPRPRIRWRAVHLAMFVTVCAVGVMGIAADSFAGELGRYALLDRLGVVPFIAFTIAPIVYFTNRQRAYLVGVLVAVGWYLGLTALLEGFGLKELTWPSYINNPAIGLHFERARGPFAESTAMGTALIGCLVGAILALRTWRSRAGRVLAALLVPVLLLGAIFTLTRAVWLAVAVALLVGLVAERRTRRFLLPVAASAAVAVVAVLALVPGLRDDVEERRSEQHAVWDRLNTNAAAVDAFLENPLVGIGWASFPRASEPYLRQHDDYPLTGRNIEVHNLLLSRLAEIGLLGTLPWLASLGLGIVATSLRPVSAELEPWRHALITYAAAFAVMGMFGPMTAPFPNLLLWLLAGVVAAPYCSRSVRTTASGRTTAAGPALELVP